MTQTPAVVFESPGRVAVRDIAMPDPGPGEVQLRTLASGVSAGTEGWCLHNRFTWQPTVYPCVPGYQRVAEVVALGDGVTGWAPGDRAIATWGRWESDVQSMWGSHVALANTPAAELHRVPEGVNVLDAASFVVAQVGWNAASRLVMEPGDWVVVYGDGLIGQCAAQAAAAMGARVVLVGHRAERLDRALFVEATVNRKQVDVVGQVREWVGSTYASAVIDTIQTEDSQREYVELLEPRFGQIVYSGFTPGTVWADMALLQQRELTAHFVCGWTYERLEATLRLMATGQMNVRDLVTHRVPFTQAPAMYAMIDAKTDPFLGICFEWC